jgi:hypothetical protein
MKTIIFALALFCCLYNVSAFWTPCQAGGRVPDDVTSPNCKNFLKIKVKILNFNCKGDSTRCWATRGEVLTARVYLTGHDVHHELMVHAYVFLFGVREWKFFPKIFYF